MKLSGSFPLVASLLNILPTAHAVVRSSWDFDIIMPPAGLSDITFPITIVETSHLRGYYFAQQFSFVGHHNIGYTGIQPRPDSGGKAVLRGVFSSFINGTTTSDKPNCEEGADGGPGVSCGVEWNGVYGRKYNFEVKTTGDRVWNGTAVDTVTGNRIHIGSYTLPAGLKGLESGQDGFVEWFLPLEDCAQLPYQKSIFGNPTTTHMGAIGMQNDAREHGDCEGKVAFHTEKVSGGVENNSGFRDQSGVRVASADKFNVQMGY